MPSDLPLLLILGVDGPEQLGVHDDDESDSLCRARNLVAAEFASWHPLAAVTVEDLRRWIGPARPDVLRALVEVTGGRAEYAGALWDDWRHRGAVEDETDGRWSFTAIGRKRALDLVGDQLNDRLKRLIGSDPDALAGAHRLLLCAALEGRRFTADAVALALERDRDDVIDTLDDKLALALIAASLELEPSYFAEYRLAELRRELNGREVGFEAAWRRYSELVR